MISPLLKLFSSDFGHFEINFQIVWINFFFRLYFRLFFYFLRVPKSGVGKFFNDVPPPRIFSSDYSHFEINFYFFFHFCLFLLILVLFIVFFTCSKNGSGTFTMMPPPSNFSHRISATLKSIFNFFKYFFYFFQYSR